MLLQHLSWRTQVPKRRRKACRIMMIFDILRVLFHDEAETQSRNITETLRGFDPKFRNGRSTMTHGECAQARSGEMKNRLHADPSSDCVFTCLPALSFEDLIQGCHEKTQKQLRSLRSKCDLSFAMGKSGRLLGSRGS